MKQTYRRGQVVGFLLALTFGVLVNVIQSRAQDRPEGRGTRDCAGEYAHYTNFAWNELDACIKETINDGWTRRLSVRTGCNIMWVMRAMSAATQFTSCSAIPIQ